MSNRTVFCESGGAGDGQKTFCRESGLSIVHMATSLLP